MLKRLLNPKIPGLQNMCQTWSALLRQQRFCCIPQTVEATCACEILRAWNHQQKCNSMSNGQTYVVDLEVGAKYLG